MHNTFIHPHTHNGFIYHLPDKVKEINNQEVNMYIIKLKENKHTLKWEFSLREKNSSLGTALEVMGQITRVKSKNK